MSRILVVDDDLEIQSLIADVLGAVGHEVEVGPHLATLVGEGFSGEFDLITMDLRMPEMDGVEIIKALRNSTETPILVISGYLNEAIISRLKQMDIGHILEKPFRRAELLEAVRTALEDQT